jgi:hypothetical protein
MAKTPRRARTMLLASAEEVGDPQPAQHREVRGCTRTLHFRYQAARPTECLGYLGMARNPHSRQGPCQGNQELELLLLALARVR